MTAADIKIHFKAFDWAKAYAREHFTCAEGAAKIVAEREQEKIMTKYIRTEQKTDISKDPFEDHFIDLEGRNNTLSFCVNNNNTPHKEDRGYVLFNLKQQGEPIDMETYFGMPREMAREFANKILEITK